MFKRILVALDRSERSEQVLPWVRGLALPAGAGVVLLHVCPEPEPVVAEGHVVAFVDQVEAQRREDATGYLEGVARTLRMAGFLVDVCVRFGEPAKEILEAAREAGADLIALATHGRSGIARLLHGSVASQVLRRAHVPVLLLREEERRAA